MLGFSFGCILKRVSFEIGGLLRPMSLFAKGAPWVSTQLFGEHEYNHSFHSVSKSTVASWGLMQPAI